MVFLSMMLKNFKVLFHSLIEISFKIYAESRYE